MKACNVQWDIDIDEIYELFDDKTVDEAAELLMIPKDWYSNMTTSERHDYIYDFIRHSPASAEEFVGLPDSIEIPDDILQWAFDEGGEDYDELISDWLSDEYGFCHRGFELFESKPSLDSEAKDMSAAKDAQDTPVAGHDKDKGVI